VKKIGEWGSGLESRGKQLGAPLKKFEKSLTLGDSTGVVGIGIHLRKAQTKEEAQEIEVSFIHSW
jgi:hypothetical protein